MAQQLSNQRIAWFNGKFMPESEVRIPFRDLSWVYGDGGFDMTRSFGHRLFKVKEHVDRLYRSLKYLRIDPGVPPKICSPTEELFERNATCSAPTTTTGSASGSAAASKRPATRLDHTGPNVVLECCRCRLQRAKLFKEGAW